MFAEFLAHDNVTYSWPGENRGGGVDNIFSSLKMSIELFNF